MTDAGNSIQPGDWLAGGALLLSVFSIFWSGHIERRLQSREDSRANFDLTLGSPLSAKLDQLDPILYRFDSICAEEISADARQERLSELQRSDHGLWFQSCEAFLKSHDPNLVDQIERYLFDYWDEMSELIDKMNLVVTSQEVNSLRRAMTRLGQRFLTSARAEIHRLRVTPQ